MKRILSGITATGHLTIGNYIGAIKNFVKLQEEYEMFIFVADLHALTNDIAPEVLRENKKEIMALYLAVGLDPKKVTLFFQSDVSAHGTMNWIMESRTTKGELERMTQFKDKSLKAKMDNGTVKIKTTLLTYPTLMAGDILLYNANFVPVGIDQKQHLELTRNIVERFNKEFGETLSMPEPFFPKIGAKIKSLQNPTKKMSKSDGNKNASIFLLDDPEIAFNKIKKAVTDSENKVYFDKENKPGVSNLINIYAAITNKDITEVEKEFKDANYGEFKLTIGNAVKTFLEELQAKYETSVLVSNKIAKEGAEKARIIADETLKNVKQKIGLM